MSPDNSHPPERREYDSERDMGRFWDAIAPKSEPFKQAWYAPLILLLIVVSVPWYRSEGFMGAIILGLPIWVWVTLACSGTLSLLTAVAILGFWKDD